MRGGILQHLRARMAGGLALRITFSTLAVVGALALGLVLADAAFDLEEGLRATAPWWLAMGALAVVGIGVWEWRRLTENRLARLLESADASLGNRLINAVQLAGQPRPAPTEEFLRREAVELGRRAAASQTAWPILRRGVKRVVVFGAAVAVAWAALFWAGGDVMEAVVPRFLDVHGDHPPYSKLKIAVAPAGAEVVYGGQLELRATARGRPADKLWLVVCTGTNATRTMMFLAPDRSFFQTLVNLREPAEYYVTDGAARSRRFPIRIRYTPQITLVEVATDFPSTPANRRARQSWATKRRRFPKAAV